MFFTIRKNFRPLPNYSTYSEYIIRTTHNSIKKDCENYVFKKKIRELINNDNLSISHSYKNTSYDFLIITITSFSIGIYSFLYFYRFKK